MATVQRPAALGKLALDEQAAWGEYLEATQIEGYRYEEVEPWAWNRLNRRLQEIQAQRRRLEDDGA